MTAHRVPLDSPLAPTEGVLAIAGTERPFALSGEWFDRPLTILGCQPSAIAEDPFAALDELASVTGDVLVGGGWVGWFGYRLGERIEQLPPGPPPVVPRPEFSLSFYDSVAVHDGERWWFETLGSDERLDFWRTTLNPEQRLGVRGVGLRFEAVGAAGHIAAVAECKERIARGDLYQANLCLRLSADHEPEPLGLFARGIAGAKPRFGACVDGVVSLSPERFLRRLGDRVWSEPIKGTRPLSADPAELESSAKDHAENVMIVDLMRNDLGRVCEFGTVNAESPRVERHAGVWHLVSTVSGKLRHGTKDGELLKATFPPGSVTGAPKVQAMKVIAELESTRREVYTGAVGIASPVAGLDLNVAIRTFEIAGGQIWLGVGGGIVADSDPEDELQEALAKAAGPLRAIDAEIAPFARRAPSKLPRALDHGQRPDPRNGIFATILLEDGVAVDLKEHLARLRAAASALYGVELSTALRARVEREAGAVWERTRLKILVGADGATEITTAPAPKTEGHREHLKAFQLPGGLGAYKWQDRRLIDALSTAGTVPLFVDSDGCVLEAGYANVWLKEGEELITPPADGRILAGTVRAVLLARKPGAREEAFDLERLRAADQVLLSSSIRRLRQAFI